MNADTILEQTRKNFVTVDMKENTGTTMRKANVGDRIIYMAISGDEDVFEVIMTKKKDVVARALTNVNGFEVGQTYRVPGQYQGGWPVVQDMGQYTLHAKPGAPAAEAKPARAPRAKPAEGGKTKIAMCREIFAANPGIDKPAMIEKFVKEAGCTPAGANTYFVTISKGY